MRRGATLLLSMEPDMEVVGQACNGVEAVSDLAQIAAPGRGVDGPAYAVEGRRGCHPRNHPQAPPNTQVLVLTTLDDDETVFEAVRVPAHTHTS